MRQRLPSFFLMKKTGEAMGDLDRHIRWLLKVLFKELVQLFLLDWRRGYIFVLNV